MIRTFVYNVICTHGTSTHKISNCMQTCIYVPHIPILSALPLPSIFHTVKEATTKYFGRWAAKSKREREGELPHTQRIYRENSRPASVHMATTTKAYKEKRE